MQATAPDTAQFEGTPDLGFTPVEAIARGEAAKQAKAAEKKQIKQDAANLQALRTRLQKDGDATRQAAADEEAEWETEIAAAKARTIDVEKKKVDLERQIDTVIKEFSTKGVQKENADFYKAKIDEEKPAAKKRKNRADEEEQRRQESFAKLDTSDEVIAPVGEGSATGYAFVEPSQPQTTPPQPKNREIFAETEAERQEEAKRKNVTKERLNNDARRIKARDKEKTDAQLAKDEEKAVFKRQMAAQEVDQELERVGAADKKAEEKRLANEEKARAEKAAEAEKTRQQFRARLAERAEEFSRKEDKALDREDIARANAERAAETAKRLKEQQEGKEELARAKEEEAQAFENETERLARIPEPTTDEVNFITNYRVENVDPSDAANEIAKLEMLKDKLKAGILFHATKKRKWYEKLFGGKEKKYEALLDAVKDRQESLHLLLSAEQRHGGLESGVDRANRKIDENERRTRGGGGPLGTPPSIR